MVVTLTTFCLCLWAFVRHLNINVLTLVETYYNFLFIVATVSDAHTPWDMNAKK